MNRIEAEFVERNQATLIQRVTSVMPIVDELINKGMIHPETYAEIRAERTNQEKMRKLFQALEAGGDRVKCDFYHALRIHEPFLFRDLGGVIENAAGHNREQNLPERMQLL